MTTDFYNQETCPKGFEFECIVTPYKGIWYNGLGDEVEIIGKALIPREVDKDGTCYLYKRIQKKESPFCDCGHLKHQGICYAEIIDEHGEPYECQCSGSF